ncbi:MAG TPA: TMEM175 family protein, partial [Candidatus Dormibacteraeota bacterium]|nr:TMEM175 family protein [Candidatus Dormibacteraeota bacterium]
MSAPTVENDERASGEQGGATDAYGVGRLLAFSDGVFAIAITLLVLSIPVPDIPHGLGIAEANTRLAAGLGGLVPSFAGFALSFFLVGSNW